MPIDQMSKGKKIRYEEWLVVVKASLADKYGITLGQAVAIIDTDGIGAISCLLHWVESDEFIIHHLTLTGRNHEADGGAQEGGASLPFRPAR